MPLLVSVFKVFPGTQGSVHTGMSCHSAFDSTEDENPVLRIQMSFNFKS